MIIVELSTPAGTALTLDLRYSTVEYSLVEGDVGALTVEGPLVYPLGWFERDCQLKVRRSVYGGTPYLEGGAVWLLQAWSFIVAESGERLYRLTALHVNSLLARRIVDAAAGSAQASKTAAADDLIKAIVSEQFVSPTDTTRTMPITVGPNLSAAPSISKAFAWRNTLEVIKDLCAASAENGTYLGFEVVPSGTSFQVVTYVNQRGLDRTADQRALFSLERRNLASGELTYDYTGVATRAIAGGQGEGTLRAVQRASDSGASAASPYALTEVFRQAAQSTSSAQVLDEAEAELWARRGRVRFSGSAQQVAGSLYGVDYQWGDVVPVSFLGQDIACRIATVRNRVQRGQGEQLDIRLSSDTVIA